jgi:hypothetical protein
MVAKLNKLLLTYPRRVEGVLRDELLREEARYRWFIRNATEVVGVLESVGANYALYKFRRPFEHVTVDLDILVRVEDVSGLLEPWSLGASKSLSGSHTWSPSLGVDLS